MSAEGLCQRNQLVKLILTLEITSRFYIKTSQKISCLKHLLPGCFWMELQGLNSVFVVKDSNVVNSKQITTGPRLGDYRLVQEGLSAGDKIVIDALQKVKEGMVIQPEVIKFESKTNPQLN